ncbi:DUF262 domain-containing protein [Ideonella sp.]|uniref:DUF262 domain-containing protein n=1 Tax=Ideonella sp. TaxID=1929293 RepID=UPI003BB554B4
MFKKDPVPDIQRLEQLVANIRRGEIRLPKFQRPFVWDKEDMLNLWDSIYNGYPIGSVLLWHSSEALKSEREIYGFSVQESPVEVYPTNYLLDGQQRLTTVCGALYWDGGNLDSIWAIHFDLDTEKFVYPKSIGQANLFPLNKLLNTSDFIRQCMRFEATSNPKKYYEAAEMLLRSVKDYKVAVVKIGDVSLDEVAPIFERINSTGRKLTMVDLMRAATWKDGFDLTQYISDFLESLALDGFRDVPESIVLRGVAAASGLGINKADIDGLRNLDVDALRESFESSKKATVAGLHFLNRELGLDDFSYLPYGIQLTYVAEFFRLNSTPSGEQLTTLREWIWTTAVTRYFSGASTGQNSRDLAEIRAFAVGSVDALSPTVPLLNLTDFIFDEFNLRTASSTTFGLLLRRHKPTADISGRAIPALKSQRKNRADYADIFSGSIFSGRNVGQVLKGQSSANVEGVTAPDLDANLVSEELAAIPGGATMSHHVRARAQLICNAVSRMTGKECQFTVPGNLQI